MEYYTGLLGVADLLEASTSKKDTPYDILAAHRAALPIAAVLSGGFERQLLARAECLFENVEEMVRKTDSVDEYFEFNH